MEINQNNIKMIIADDSEKALKIKEGYNYSITQSGDLIIGEMGIVIKNKYQLKNKISQIKDIPDIKKVLEELSEIMN